LAWRPKGGIRGLAQAPGHHQGSRLDPALPDGDVAVVHLEADDLNRALAGMGTSENPFDRWLRQLGLEVHGVDLKAGFPPLEQVLDFSGFDGPS
jgi:hypothetical protein